MVYSSQQVNKYMQPFKEYMANWFGTRETEEIRTTNDLNVIWIHGANQTSLSFNYLREKTKFANEILVNYSSSDHFTYNLDKISEQIQNKGPHFVIGHSMGGLYALHLTQMHRIVAGVSISTPFAGSWTADWAKYVVPSYPLFRDIGRRSGPNDGVVTIESMKARTDMTQIEVAHTHYETMCSIQVAEILSSCYSRALAKVH